MNISTVLIANRGEVAIRIARAAARVGLDAVTVYATDDAQSLHSCYGQRSEPLAHGGPAAYLDGEALIDIARRCGCDAVHPGYGFLSEDARFADQCRRAGLIFVGPHTAALQALGHKPSARALAVRCNVPVLGRDPAASTLEEARALLEERGTACGVMIKAAMGGGGRGMRVVTSSDELAAAWRVCEAEAYAAFGNGELYAEPFVVRARHIEVQTVGDGSGAVAHFWERDCSLQRRNQKLIEIAPAAGLACELRDALISDACRMAAEIRLDSLATFEFLVPVGADQNSEAIPSYAFLEANPRLQVEHTVTEEVTGIDLASLQLEIAGGRSLSECGIDPASPPPLRGACVQVRINAETIDSEGRVKPSCGELKSFVPPGGPGVRVETHGFTGAEVGPRYDSLLAKIVCYDSGGADAALRKSATAVSEFVVTGVETSRPFLRAILTHADTARGATYTRWIEHNARQLHELARGDKSLHHDPASPATPDPNLPAATDEAPAGTVAVRAPLHSVIVGFDVRPGDEIPAGAQVAVLEAMKMQHVVLADVAGTVFALAAQSGATVSEGQTLLFVEPGDVDVLTQDTATVSDPTEIRRDLAEALERRALTRDAARPDAVARRRKSGQRTARENIDDLCDEGSFREYGALVIAAQRRRRELKELIERTPADGLVAGVGSVNGDLFPGGGTQCVAMSYDYTVLAGTQGTQNHRKKDRMLEIAERSRMPVVLFAEGGGGRPGDTDMSVIAGLDCLAFEYFAKLSGLVPLVGIVSGRCFAGNAALLGCCDVIIATENANIGMGGPAMIEGGGLGVFSPEEVGPIGVQVANGVVDIAVRDEAEAVHVAKRYLGYFQGAVRPSGCADQRGLRLVIPENRMRVYEIRDVIRTLSDTDSVLELRPQFGRAMVTAFARIEGRPLGIVANNPMHISGAIDADAADKAARFLQLCDAHDLPVVFLCDTPGFMVGPQAEKTALVRHVARMFVAGASITVPFMTIVLRKCYGLGAMAMAGGGYKNPMFAVTWPTGEFGGMGLEGAVRLGYRRELEAAGSAAQRRALFEKLVAREYEHGKALNVATNFEIDEVIDPAESRAWILTALDSAPPAPPRTGKKRPNIDTW